MSVTVYDVADKILQSFDKRLADYATKRFARQGINVRTGTRVRQVQAHKLVFEDGSEDSFGAVVWATGIAPSSLVRSLQTSKDPSGRILTNAHLQVLGLDGTPIPGVYALGDCAAIKDFPLPATAQVAKQKAIYLARRT